LATVHRVCIRPRSSSHSIYWCAGRRARRAGDLFVSVTALPLICAMRMTLCGNGLRASDGCSGRLADRCRGMGVDSGNPAATATTAHNDMHIWRRNDGGDRSTNEEPHGRINHIAHSCVTDCWSDSRRNCRARSSIGCSQPSRILPSRGYQHRWWAASGPTGKRSSLRGSLGTFPQRRSTGSLCCPSR
jgi:hypothetical protein